MNYRGTQSFDMNMKKLLSYSARVVCSFSASSEMWIPIMSERAYVTANTIMPTNMANLDWVPEYNPAISPKVLMVPEVIPNPHPFQSFPP